ncbi:hypothetical protein H2248_000467 [Termitomyces sp. 'cryptogamus']|nr:hypothetical protein H2248_000467 [Termitomyces sp. 'cryptogamus']
MRNLGSAGRSSSRRKRKRKRKLALMRFWKLTGETETMGFVRHAGVQIMSYVRDELWYGKLSKGF